MDNKLKRVFLAAIWALPASLPLPSHAAAVVASEDIFTDSPQGHWVIDNWNDPDTDVSIQGEVVASGGSAIRVYHHHFSGFSLDSRAADWSRTYEVPFDKYSHLVFDFNPG